MDEILDWLYSINYPFDFSFTPPPPIDFHALAEIWRIRDDWTGVLPEEAYLCVAEEAGLEL